jgi:hypothetical protein
MLFYKLQRKKHQKCEKFPFENDLCCGVSKKNCQKQFETSFLTDGSNSISGNLKLIISLDVFVLVKGESD